MKMRLVQRLLCLPMLIVGSLSIAAESPKLLTSYQTPVEEKNSGVEFFRIWKNSLIDADASLREIIKDRPVIRNRFDKRYVYVSGKQKMSHGPGIYAENHTVYINDVCLKVELSPSDEILGLQVATPVLSHGTMLDCNSPALSYQAYSPAQEIRNGKTLNIFHIEPLAMKKMVADKRYGEGLSSRRAGSRRAERRANRYYKRHGEEEAVWPPRSRYPFNLYRIYGGPSKNGEKPNLFLIVYDINWDLDPTKASLDQLFPRNYIKYSFAE